LLTANYVVEGKDQQGKGKTVYRQPPPPNGPQIGSVYKLDKDYGYALVTVTSGSASNALVTHAPRSIVGIADADEGARVLLVGSGSGKSETQPVMALAPEPTLGLDESVKFIVTGRLSQPKDAGAPVLTPDGRLIGMLYMASVTTYEPEGDRSFVIPIKTIF